MDKDKIIDNDMIELGDTPKETEVAKAPTKIKTIVEIRDKYLRNNLIVDNFGEYETYKKLAYLQNTPRKFVKTRAVGGIKVPYVDHVYAEKCLNFAFNFRISTEILKEDFRHAKEGTKDVHIARVTVKFTFGDAPNQIVRTVISTHKGYPNAAIPDEDALKSAVSKAWTIVARTFGIGADLKDAPEILEKQAQKVERKAVEKAFPESKVKVEVIDEEDYFGPDF